MTAVDGRSETVELAHRIEQIRGEFPGLSDGRAALDGAAGTQLPAAVIDAVVAAMREAMANVHGTFPGSERSTETVQRARLAVADLVGGTPDGVLLGPNMTTLTFMLADSRAAARIWRSNGNTLSIHHRATSGNDSSRSVSPVGAQSTTTTSQTPES